MNANDLSRIRKGAIFNAHNSASSIAVMGKTSRFFGRIAMTCTGKKRPFAAKKRGALFSFCFVGRNSSGAVLANLFPCFGRTNIATKFLHQVAMPFVQMLSLGKAFKVIGAVVGFVSVYVMDMLGWGKPLDPAGRHNAVHKPVPSEAQISSSIICGGVRLQLSDDFSATRNCVKMVKKSVLDFCYRNANHVVPSLVVMESSF